MSNETLLETPAQLLGAFRSYARITRAYPKLRIRTGHWIAVALHSAGVERWERGDAGLLFAAFGDMR